MQQLQPGSYIVLDSREVYSFAVNKLGSTPEKLTLHPDFHGIDGQETLSLGIEKIREVSSRLHMRPLVASYKFLVIENFHFATIEAQNAFLKTFEEPPAYAYIFLITPYIDRLLKTIVSRAQVLQGNKRQEASGKQPSVNLAFLLTLAPGERLLWLDKEVKEKEKADAKQLYISIIDECLKQGLKLVKQQQLSLESFTYLKDAKWKIEQGFPQPKLLLEGFLIHDS